VKGERLRCKNSGAVERQLGRQLAPYSKERRSFLCSVATAGAGLAGSAILPLSAEAQRKPESPKAFAATTCGNSRVIASDKTVAETTAGKIRGFRRNGVYIFKGVPYGASTAGPRRFMPRRVPSPGAEFATRSSMVVSVLTRIALTSTPMERISRVRMKMHSYSIVVPLPQFQVRTACASIFGHQRSMVPINAQ
jgi:Carboxylesterase family